MALIPSYLEFEGSISIPNVLPTKPSGEALATLMSYEVPKMLTDVLGYELYTLLYANQAQGSGIYHDIINGVEFTDSLDRLNKWVGFVRGSNPIANYIYFKWMAQTASTSTGVGEKVPNAENMVSGDVAIKANRAWNQMSDWLTVLHDYLTINEADYPSYLGLDYSPYTQGNPNYKYFQKLPLVVL